MARQQKKTKKRHKISDHFSRNDFKCKTNPNDDGFKISAGLIGALELLRNRSKNRINIEKGYECLEAAEKIGKVKRNYHIQGLAANITIDNMTLADAFLLAESIPEFTGIGANYDESYLHLRTYKRSSERDLWVIKKGEEILVTEDNRDKLLELPVRSIKDTHPVSD